MSDNQPGMLSMPEAGSEGKFSWSSPSNIALIKYWGKKDCQIPLNPSLSLSLKNSKSISSISYTVLDKPDFNREFLFHGEKMPSFEPKIDEFLNVMKNELPFLEYLSLLIESSNTFPHSAGIASSASAMSSLALCIAEIEAQFYGLPNDNPDFFRRASYLARLGSGSAARSVFGNYVVWGQTNLVTESSDLYAVELKSEIHPFFKMLQNYILVTDSTTKKLSSSSGHDAMKIHPYAEGRLVQANNNFSHLINILKSGDWDSFISIVENEALSLHALLLSSNPGYILMKPETLRMIERIRSFRKESGLFLCFSLDAGPNIHLLFHENDKSEIEAFTNSELRKFCEKTNIIKDLAGGGPERIRND